MPGEAELVSTYDIGCRPSPSGSGEVLIQDDTTSFVIFDAMSSTLSKNGGYESLGIAAVEIRDCHLTKYGYPNDEGLIEHPLYYKGLDSAPGVGEVHNSSWMAMLDEQMVTSAMRILGYPDRKAYAAVRASNSKVKLRHFIFTFKENTFECLAGELKVISVGRSFKETLYDVCRRILEG
jgi:hypothetical protein